MSIEHKLTLPYLQKSLKSLEKWPSLVTAAKEVLVSGKSKNPRYNLSLVATEGDAIRIVHNIGLACMKIDQGMPVKLAAIEDKKEERKGQIRQLQIEGIREMLATGILKPELVAKAKISLPCAQRTVCEDKKSLGQVQEIVSPEEAHQELEDMALLATAVYNRRMVKVNFSNGEQEVFHLEQEVVDLCSTVTGMELPEKVFPSAKEKNEYDRQIRSRAWKRIQALFKHVDEKGDFPAILEGYGNKEVKDAAYLLLTWLYDRKDVFKDGLENFLFGNDISFCGRVAVDDKRVEMQGGNLEWRAPETLTAARFRESLTQKIEDQDSKTPIRQLTEDEKLKEMLGRWQAGNGKRPAEVQSLDKQQGTDSHSEIEKRLRQEINECLDRLVEVTRSRCNVGFSLTQPVAGDFISGFININLRNFKAVERILQKRKLIVGIHKGGSHYDYLPEAIPVFDHYTRDKNINHLKIVARLAKEEVAKRIANNGNNTLK